MKTKLIKEIAKKCTWHKTVNKEYLDQCENEINTLNGLLPSGSGIDCGCVIDAEKSDSKKVVITFTFHHLHENGYYTGWTSHKAIITPSLSNDFNLKITGKDKPGLKDYLVELFDLYLNEDIETDLIYK